MVKTDPNVLKALDCLYGAVESLQIYLVWKDKFNEDLRDAGHALNQAQDAISALRDEVKEV